MNNDDKTTKYLEKLKDMKLSESSRARIEGNLQEYARFHTVRVGQDNRSIGQVPKSTFLSRLKMTPMPIIAILITVFVGAGTSFAAQGAVPGDFLYPVKTEVNENVRAAFAVGANAEAELQADLLEERLAEAAKLQAEGRLTSERAVVVANKIKTQAQIVSDASAKSDAAVATNINERVNLALQNFLENSRLDSSLTADISASFGTMLSKGSMAIDSYQTDMKNRVSALRSVVERYRTELKAEVHAELSAKLHTASLLVAEASTKVEAEARTTLDKAAKLAGEVESKLSTLGQAEVDVNTGIITDIDFSIDPMKIDIRSDTRTGSDTDTSSEVDEDTDTTTDLEIDANTSSNVDTEIIDVDAQTDTSVQSGLSL